MFYALVCRVALGYPARTQQSGPEAKTIEGGHPVFRPGCFRELNHIPNVEPPMFHHSLIAEDSMCDYADLQIALLDRGVDPNIPDQSGDSAIRRTKRKKTNPKIVELPKAAAG